MHARGRERQGEREGGEERETHEQPGTPAQPEKDLSGNPPNFLTRPGGFSASRNVWADGFLT